MTLVGIISDNDTFEFPLKKTDVFAKSVDGVAIVGLRQTYYNNSNQRVNSHYRFPVYRDATVNDFTVQFAKGTIKCYVEEVEQAKKTYADAVEKGKQAALMNENSKEDYDVTIGNIDKEEMVVVTIKYILHLERDVDTDGRRFVLPTTITPRYDNRERKRNDAPNWDAPKMKNPLSLYNRSYDDGKLGEATWTSNAPSKAESHEEERPKDSDDDDEDDTKKDILYSRGAEQATINVRLDVTETAGIDELIPPKFNGKIVKKSKITETRFVLEAENISLGEDYVVTIVKNANAVPSLEAFAEKWVGNGEHGEHGEQEGQEKSEAEAPSCTVNLTLPESQVFSVSQDKRFEFIFVIDRSGSMLGPQIENAKRALALMLNSLPMDSYYNFYGFGSTWKRFYPNSVKYGQQVFQESKRMIERIQADMGGTEMTEVLNAVYSTSKVEGYERRVMLLTDGEISDLQSVFDIVESDPDVPVFTIGVGDSVSHELVKGIAERTMGHCEVIMDADLIETKVLQQLKRAMYDKVVVEVGGNKIPLRPGQERCLCIVPLSEFPERSGNGEDYLGVAFNEDEESNVIPLHWIDEKDDETGVDGRTSIDDDLASGLCPLRLTWADEQVRRLEMRDSDKTHRREMAVKLSKRYHILTPYTSFVGVLESKDKGEKEEKNGETKEGNVAKVTITSPLHPGKYADSRYSEKKRKCYAQQIRWDIPVSGVCRSGGSSSISLASSLSGTSFFKNNNLQNFYKQHTLEDIDEEDEDGEKEEVGSFSGSFSGSGSLSSLANTPWENAIAVFMKAIQFDGSVSWKAVNRSFALPPVPSEPKGCTETIWATCLFVAFVTVNGVQDSIKCKMIVEKSMVYLTRQGTDPEWYAAALDYFVEGNRS